MRDIDEYNGGCVLLMTLKTGCAGWSIPCSMMIVMNSMWNPCTMKQVMRAVIINNLIQVLDRITRFDSIHDVATYYDFKIENTWDNRVREVSGMKLKEADKIMSAVLLTKGNQREWESSLLGQAVADFDRMNHL